ncbi:MAG TPA: hypothetical protein VEA41_15320 [Salinarimonas sp.]|nr:hypothetical protein [Salinarimonas sp.]
MTGDKKVRLGGLWSNTSKAGKKYLSGKLGGLKFIAFEVAVKKSEKSPDYELYLVEEDKKPEGMQSGTRLRDADDSDMPF